MYGEWSCTVCVCCLVLSLPLVNDTTTDCAFGFLLYPLPQQTYHPLWDNTVPPEERVERFHQWAAAYFPHGDPITADTLVFHDDPDGLSSLKNMTSEEQAESTHETPGHIPDGSDTLTAKLCATYGLYRELKDMAFYPSSRTAADEASDPWRDVEVRVIWCDQSLWAIPWVAKGMATELEEAERTGTPTRRVSLVRVRGGNHFVGALYVANVGKCSLYHSFRLIGIFQRKCCEAFSEMTQRCRTGCAGLLWTTSPLSSLLILFTSNYVVISVALLG